MRIKRHLWFNTDPAAPAGGGAPAAAPPAAPPAAAPAATPPAAGGGGVLAVTPAAGAPATPPAPAKLWHADVPATWRDDLAATLPAELQKPGKSFLDRVPSLQDFTRNYVTAQQRISAGLPPENVPYLPKDATPEQVANYRKAVDVPETSDKYEVALDAGLVLSPEDRTMFQPIFATLHAANTPTPVVSSLVNEYLKLEQKNLAAVALADEQAKQTCTAALKGVWGADYERNIGLLEMLFVDLPASVKENFLGGRLADGTALFNSPEVVMFFLGKQRELNPMATVTTQTGAAAVKAIDDEIAALKGRMANDPKWFSDDAAQARYRQLIDAKAQQAAKK